MSDSNKKDENNTHQEAGFNYPKFEVETSSRLAQQILEEAKVSAALIGRIAIWYWIEDPSEHEFTKDLDFAVPVEDISKIASALKKKGFMLSELEIGGINLRVPDEGISIDFIHRQSQTLGDLSNLFRKAIEEALESSQITDGPSLPHRIVALDYLLIMKLATGEDKDRRDALRLITHARQEVNVEKVRKLLKSYGLIAALGIFEQLLRDAGHPEARGRGRYKKPHR